MSLHGVLKTRIAVDARAVYDSIRYTIRMRTLTRLKNIERGLLDKARPLRIYERHYRSTINRAVTRFALGV